MKIPFWTWQGTGYLFEQGSLAVDYDSTFLSQLLNSIRSLTRVMGSRVSLPAMINFRKFIVIYNDYVYWNNLSAFLESCIS